MSNEPPGAIDRDFDESVSNPDHVTEIKALDVCVDLQTRQVVYVVGKKADTVAAYRDDEGFDLGAYKAHPYMPVHDTDPVYECVFVPSNPDDLMHPERSLKTYDFPRGRLARVAIECATGDARPQETFLRTALTAMLSHADDAGTADAVVDAARTVFGSIADDAVLDSSVDTDGDTELGDFE